MRKLDTTLARTLAPEDLSALRDLGRVASSAGFRVSLVGGAVRDALLGIGSRDLDVVVEGDVRALVDRFGAGRDAKVVTHPRFGTASTSLPSGAHLDLAEARRETYAEPGALPSVSAASLESDLARRDFTVNAMAVRLGPERFGLLVDPFGGERDLARRRIRVLHAASFRDDPTRALRAAQLCARGGFRLERETAGLLREAVRAGAVERLSRRRLGREIEKLFGPPHAARAASCLEKVGLLPIVSLPRGKGSVPYAALRRSDRLLRWRAERFPDEPVISWAIPVAILADSGSPAQRKALVDRLAPDRRSAAILLRGTDEARVVARRAGAPAGARASRLARVCRGVAVETLFLAAALSTGGAAPRRIRRYLAELRFVRADVTGRDLLRGGVAAGPGIARGLEAAIDAKLDGAAPETQLRAALRAALRA